MTALLFVPSKLTIKERDGSIRERHFRGRRLGPNVNAAARVALHRSSSVSTPGRRMARR
jgi:hypothetical protein